MPHDLKTGHFYCLGRCKSTGDRSYLDGVWEILEVTETHAVIKAMKPRRSGFGKEPMLVLIGEFDWTDGSKIVACLAEYPAGGQS